MAKKTDDYVHLIITRTVEVSLSQFIFMFLLVTVKSSNPISCDSLINLTKYNCVDNTQRCNETIRKKKKKYSYFKILRCLSCIYYCLWFWSPELRSTFLKYPLTTCVFPNIILWRKLMAILNMWKYKRFYLTSFYLFFIAEFYMKLLKWQRKTNLYM